MKYAIPTQSTLAVNTNVKGTAASHKTSGVAGSTVSVRDAVVPASPKTSKTSKKNTKNTKKKAKHTHCKRVSDKIINKINALAAEGWSDHWISEQKFAIKRELSPVEIMHVRYGFWKDLDTGNVRNMLHKPKPTNKNKNAPKQKVRPTSFGQPNGNKPWHQMFDRIDPETGLPQKPKGVGRPHGARDINLLITDCFCYSIQELKKIIKYRQLDGRSLSAGVLMVVKQVLVSLTGSPKESLNATKWLIERKYGAPVTKIANADGTNINPLMALLTSDSKLKPKN